MTHDEALDILQDEYYKFQQLEDELMGIESSGDIHGESKRAKEIYSQMSKMIKDIEVYGQLQLF